MLSNAAVTAWAALACLLTPVAQARADVQPAPDGKADAAI